MDSKEIHEPSQRHMFQKFKAASYPLLCPIAWITQETWKEKKTKKKGVSINPWQCISIDSSSQIQPSDCREEMRRIQVLPSRTVCPLRETRFTHKTTLEPILVFPTRLQNLKVKDLPHICNISTLPWKKSVPSSISYHIKLWKCGEIGKDVLCKYLEKTMTIGRINI